MQYAKKLRKGDRVAIVSLSSGILGEAFCSHNIEIGVKRLKEYELEPVFMPSALKGIEYLKTHPEARAKDLKDAFFDDSIAGIIGPSFICDLGEIANEMLPYSKKAFEGYLEGNDYNQIVSSVVWYEERTDFSRLAIGTERAAHKEVRIFKENCWGCLESLYDILTVNR